MRMWEEGVGMEGNGVDLDREVGSMKGKWMQKERKRGRRATVDGGARRERYKWTEHERKM